MSRYGAKLTGKCITDQLQVRNLLLIARPHETLGRHLSLHFDETRAQVRRRERGCT
jgi:hypothetical protein